MLATIIKVILCVLSVVIVALVLLQKPKEDGVSGAAFGQAGGTKDRFRGGSSDEKLAVLTKVASGVFVVLTIAMIFI